MKRLFLTASAAALLLGAAACSDADSGMDKAADTASDIYAEQPIDRAGEPADETADVNATELNDGDVETVTVRQAYVPAPAEFFASDLIGEPVVDMAGQETGKVEDVMLSTANLQPMLIVRDGVAGELRPVSFTQASVTKDAEGDIVAKLDLAEATLDAIPAFEQEGFDDYRLASELMGTNVVMAFNDGTARVTDFLMAPDGKAKYAIVADGVAAALTSERFIVDPAKIVIAQGDSQGEVILDITADEFANAKSIDIAD